MYLQSPYSTKNVVVYLFNPNTLIFNHSVKFPREAIPSRLFKVRLKKEEQMVSVYKQNNPG